MVEDAPQEPGTRLQCFSTTGWFRSLTRAFKKLRAAHTSTDDMQCNQLITRLEKVRAWRVGNAPAVV